MWLPFGSCSLGLLDAPRLPSFTGHDNIASAHSFSDPSHNYLHCWSFLCTQCCDLAGQHVVFRELMHMEREVWREKQARVALKPGCLARREDTALQALLTPTSLSWLQSSCCNFHGDQCCPAELWICSILDAPSWTQVSMWEWAVWEGAAGCCGLGAAGTVSFSSAREVSLYQCHGCC